MESTINIATNLNPIKRLLVICLVAFFMQLPCLAQQSVVDSLKIELKESKRLIMMLESNAKKPTLNESELEIQNMIFDMHKAWIELPKTKSPTTILKYFRPNYVVSQLSVSTENRATIKRYSQDDFGDHINKVMSEDQFRYEFGSVKLLDIEIKDETYYNVVYKCTLRTYVENKQTETSYLIVTISGKKSNNKWRIARYSWVSFDYGH